MATLRRLDWATADSLISAHTREVRSSHLCDYPLVSVSLTTYNHRRFIRDAIDSILSQKTTFSYELVIGDDCSQDGTSELIRDYQRRYPTHIRLLLATQTLGRYTGNGRLNFIRLLRACRGKYIALLEGDDYWTDNDKLQLQTTFLEHHSDYVGAFHDSLVVHNNDLSIPEVWRFPYDGRLDFSLPDTINIVPLFHTSSLVFRTEHLPRLPPSFLTVPSADMMLFTLLATRGRYRRIPRVMSTYRKHDQGITVVTPWHLGFGLRLNRNIMFYKLRPLLGPREQQACSEYIRSDIQLTAQVYLPELTWRELATFVHNCRRWAGTWATFYMLGRIFCNRIIILYKRLYYPCVRFVKSALKPLVRLTRSVTRLSCGDDTSTTLSKSRNISSGYSKGAKETSP